MEHRILEPAENLGQPVDQQQLERTQEFRRKGLVRSSLERKWSLVRGQQVDQLDPAPFASFSFLRENKFFVATLQVFSISKVEILGRVYSPIRILRIPSERRTSAIGWRNSLNFSRMRFPFRNRAMLLSLRPRNVKRRGSGYKKGLNKNGKYPNFRLCLLGFY